MPTWPEHLAKTEPEIIINAMTSMGKSADESAADIARLIEQAMKKKASY